MFEITDSAAKQFKMSATSIADGSLSLRITAKKSAVSGMTYNMGFDKPAEGDQTCAINGLNIIVDAHSVENVKDMIIDFRDFEGKEQFVFFNPNDEKESCETSSSGCDPEGNPSCKSCKDEE